MSDWMRPGKTPGSRLAEARVASNKPDPEALRSLQALRRAIPVGNKLCAVKEHVHMEQERIRRLKAMKPQIDAKPPKVCGMAHLKTNWKRDENAACKFDQIEKQNRQLLHKMGQMANENTLGVHTRSMPSLPANSAFSFPGGPARKSEIIRIEKENMKLLHRLQNAQPYYDVRSWEAAHAKTRDIMRGMSEYPAPKPKKWLSPTASLTPIASDDVSAIQDMTMEDSMGLGAVAPYPTGAPPEALRYVLKEDCLIEGLPCFVEMATDGETLAVSACFQGEQDTLELLVNAEDYYQLYHKTGGNFQLIANMLRVLDGGQLVIDQSLQDGGNPVRDN